MLHPHTKIQFINELMGYGIFATRLIPKGSITYVKDSLEIEITPTELSKHSNALQEHIEKYSFREKNGLRVISWDLAKYVNHCCDPNSLSTPFGFEIAIKDILPGEEITDDYGMFFIEQDMPCACQAPNCRKVITPNDSEFMTQKWNEVLKPIMSSIFETEQPLIDLLPEETTKALVSNASTSDFFRSFDNLNFTHDDYLSV